MIGDVCGKGPEAASLTALARYTVRTASSSESSPSQVLRTLHDSIKLGAFRLPLLHRRPGANPGAIERRRQGATDRLARRPSPADHPSEEWEGRPDRPAKDPARRPPLPCAGRCGRRVGHRRLADPLHGRRAGRPGSAPPAATRTGSPGRWQSSRARMRTRSRGRSHKRRSPATAGSPATTSPSWCCTATATEVDARVLPKRS